MESRTSRYGVTAYTVLLLTFSGSACSQAQGPAHDPGVRDPTGPAGAGDTYPGLSAPLQNLFTAGQGAFGQVEAIDDGLGPRMNLNSCAACHANPATGGSSPGDNPQIAFFNALVNHNANTLPSFITQKGPVREARFKQFRKAEDPKNAGPDGGVHDLFTIAGRDIALHVPRL